jgi:hypothetical protein
MRLIEHLQSCIALSIYLKILATFGIITILRRQKEARNSECNFAPEHKNVHFLRDDTEHEQPSVKKAASPEFKKANEVEGEFTKVPLDPRVPDRTVCA